MPMDQSEEPMCWFVMRDLKRPNAKEPAYKQLGELNIEVFTPLRWHLSIKKGKREREKVPFIQDLLFVHDTQKHLDSIVGRISTLQYRYQKGKGYRSPMTVPDNDMERFIHAVESTDNPSYYSSIFVSWVEIWMAMKGCYSLHAGLKPNAFLLSCPIGLWLR